MVSNWRHYIVTHSGIIRGKARVKGTRIPVALILGYLNAGYSVEKIIEEFPDLDKDQISACVDYGRTLEDFEEIV